MNIEVLEMLMKKNNIKSYYELARKMDFPYTTLLDLVHNKTERLSSFKRISEFFKVSLILLLEETKYQFLIDEDDVVQIDMITDVSKEENLISNNLLKLL